MSKVVRLDDQVLEGLDKIARYLERDLFQNDNTMNKLVFEKENENFYIKFLVMRFIEDRDIK